jgi:hypothetical protein
MFRWKVRRRSVSNPNDPITVYIAADRIGVEIVRGRLETEGIPAMLAYESVG